MSRSLREPLALAASFPTRRCAARGRVLVQGLSPAAARGLLQRKLGPAREAARKAGRPRPDRDDLFDAETKSARGSAYLRQMTDRYGGQFVLTVASYNAGPNAVARWLPDAPLDADVWIEYVPYNETRKYVEQIGRAHV